VRWGWHDREGRRDAVLLPGSGGDSQEHRRTVPAVPVLWGFRRRARDEWGRRCV